MLLDLRSGNRQAVLVNNSASQRERCFHDGHQFAGPKLFQVFAVDCGKRLLCTAGDHRRLRKLPVARPKSKPRMARRNEADAPASLSISTADRHGVKETKAFARTLAMRGIRRAGGLEPDFRIRER